jgi:hypothetical protein
MHGMNIKLDQRQITGRQYQRYAVVHCCFTDTSFSSDLSCFFILKVKEEHKN